MQRHLQLQFLQVCFLIIIIWGCEYSLLILTIPSISLLRKKQGQLPTGILCHVAKATGYSSVSDLLHAKSPENSALSKNVSDTGASPKNQSASKKV